MGQNLAGRTGAGSHAEAAEFRWRAPECFGRAIRKSRYRVPQGNISVSCFRFHRVSTKIVCSQPERVIVCILAAPTIIQRVDGPFAPPG
jgi:hypothetical protein